MAQLAQLAQALQAVVHIEAARQNEAAWAVTQQEPEVLLAVPQTASCRRRFADHRLQSYKPNTT